MARYLYITEICPHMLPASLLELHTKDCREFHLASYISLTSVDDFFIIYLFCFLIVYYGLKLTITFSS